MPNGIVHAARGAEPANRRCYVKSLADVEVQMATHALDAVIHALVYVTSATVPTGILWRVVVPG
jgi:hypothetical protein